MKTLFRYIASLYLWNVAALLALIFTLVIVVDLFVNLDEFNQAAEQVRGVGGDEESVFRQIIVTAMLVIDLWWPRVLQLFNYLIGVVLVAAMGFTCWQLVRHREFVAILAGGISLHRAARPFLFIALIFTVIAALNQELVLPRIAHLLDRDPNDSGTRTPVAFPLPLTPDGTGRVFHAWQFNEKDERLERVHIWEPDADDRLTQMIEADIATWQNNAWVLENIDPTSGEPVLIARVETTLDPMQLRVRHVRGFGANLSWRQISTMLDQPALPDADRDRLQRIRWGRIGALFSNYLTLVVALPFFLTRLPQNMLRASLRSAPICVLGLIAAAASSTAILPGLPVWIGAFVPSLILAPFAIAFMSGIKS